MGLAIPITLDGTAYALIPGTYHESRPRGKVTRIAVTGAVDRTESGIWIKRFAFTLSCSLSRLANYETTLQKVTPPTNLLDFIDRRGFSWLVGAGVNDATHAYGTGVYIDSNYEPERVNDAGDWDDTNSFTVPCVLIVNSKGFKT